MREKGLLLSICHSSEEANYSHNRPDNVNFPVFHIWFINCLMNL